MENWVYIVFILSIGVVTTEVLYFDNNQHQTPKKSTEEQTTTHLPLSALFSQSKNYNCILGNQENCEKDLNNADSDTKKIFYGPKFQKVHLALPRRKQQEVGFSENVTLNNRVMTITTLSNSPQIYEITNFLSSNETELIIEFAKQKGLKKAKAKESKIFLPEVMSQEIFDDWDKDFDGHLSFNEFGDIAELNPFILSIEALSQLIQQSELDQDKNSYISYGELSRGGIQKFKDSLSEYEHARREFQVNGVDEQWVWHDEDELLMYEELLEDFHERVNKVSGVPTDLLEQTEPLQVRRYLQNSSSHCQQDSTSVDEKPCCVYGGTNCRMCRYATILIFLNDEQDGGELLFPFADNQTFSWLDLKQDTINKCEKVPNASASNVVVKPKRGSAIMWYNHALSPHTGWMSHLDPQSLVGISPIKNGTLWTAKLWMNIIGDGVNELRPWRMGTNWLSENNQNSEIIEDMRNDDFYVGETYIHQYKTSYKRQHKNEAEVTLEATNDQTEEKTFSQIQGVDSAQSYSVKVTDQKDQSTVETAPSEVKKAVPKETTGFHMSLKTAHQPNNEDIKAFNNNSTKTNIGTRNVSTNKLATNSPDEENEELTTVESSDAKVEDGLPLGPPKRPLDLKPYYGSKIIENRLVKASLLLLEELERDELEIIARTLHEKLQLACIPLIVNPIL